MLITLITAIFALAIGVLVLWANPHRFPNQIFAVLVLILSAYLVFLYKYRLQVITGGWNAETQFWILSCSTVSSFFPWAAWLLRESLLSESESRLRTTLRSLRWFALGGVFSALCFHETYFARGLTYYARLAGLLATYLFLTIQTWMILRRQVGVKRIELQFFVLNFCVAGFAATIVTALRVILEHVLPPFSNNVIASLIILLACAITAWALTYYRIFEVGQVFRSLGQKVGFLVSICVGIILLNHGLQSFCPPFTALVLSISIISPFGFWLDRRSRQWLDADGEQKLGEARRAIIAIARSEARVEKLIPAFASFLRERWNTSKVVFLFERDGIFRTNELVLERDSAFVLLCSAGWATPESLERSRNRPGSRELLRFMREHELGMLVASPAGSRTPSLVVALGARVHSWPYTYPDVQRFQNLVELMDNIFTRSRLTMQVAAQARAEHLAVMSRGLAHDLKNLITPVSSFLIHTDDRFPPGSPEAEVHADARRSMRVMTDYVREALFFSERLAPRLGTLEFPALFQTVRELTSTRASRRNISVSFQTNHQSPISADAILIQRMLVNLVNNAIDASAAGQCVTAVAETGAPGWVRLKVVDEGCGISPENFEKVFEPYFTTKEFGDDVRGFGLGLTVCQKIIDVHGGRISMQSELNRGTVFTVDLPTTPPA